jgi:hypothetical protein
MIFFVTWQELLIDLEGDRALLEMLVDEGIARAPLERTYTWQEAEQLRSLHDLVRDLKLEVAGVLGNRVSGAARRGTRRSPG